MWEKRGEGGVCLQSALEIRRLGERRVFRICHSGMRWGFRVIQSIGFEGGEKLGGAYEGVFFWKISFDLNEQ